jgi:DNA-binding SARP family transcriptional activator
VLGPLEVHADGRPLPLGGTRQRALLALLLLRANQVVSSDRLLEELWPEDQPLAGRAALRVRVSQLRKALGADIVETRAPGYVLSAAPEQLDLNRFERLTSEAGRDLEAGNAERASALLREALALWRGPALAELTYEPFAQPEIGRLEELRLVALERRVDADLALGRHAELVAELEAAVAEHPLRERFRSQLMLALYRCGRQAEALEAYQEARRVLVDELGIEPSRALHELEAAILRQDPALDLPAADAQAARAPAPSPAPSRALLVAVRDPRNADALAALGEPLARSPERELILARLVDIGGDLAAAMALLRERQAALTASGTNARLAAFTSEAAGEDLARLASEQDVDLLLLDAAPDELAEGFPALLEAAPCDVGLLVVGDEPPSVGADRPVAVPFGGVEHDWAAVEVGAWLAQATGAPLALLGTLADPERGRRDASRLLASASLIVQRVTGVVAEPRLAEPGVDGVAAAASGAGLLVVGLSPRWRREGIGAERIELARRAAPALIVRKGLRPGGLAPPESLTRFTWTLAG